MNLLNGLLRSEVFASISPYVESVPQPKPCSQHVHSNQHRSMKRSHSRALEPMSRQSARPPCENDKSYRVLDVRPDQNEAKQAQSIDGQSTHKEIPRSVVVKITPLTIIGNLSECPPPVKRGKTMGRRAVAFTEDSVSRAIRAVR